VELLCTGACDDDQYLKPDGCCAENPCDACPDGLVCIDDSLNGGKFCLDCSCGACDRDDNTCCRINAKGNNCVSNNGFADNKDCSLQDNFFPSIVGDGNFCSGVELKRSLISKNSCGCKPNSASPCIYDPSDNGNEQCLLCRATDLLDSVARVNNQCDSCVVCLSTPPTCSNNLQKCLQDAASDTAAAKACIANLDDTCRSGCDNVCKKISA
jgi:hypothetical protein